MHVHEDSGFDLFYSSTESTRKSPKLTNQLNRKKPQKTTKETTNKPLLKSLNFKTIFSSLPPEFVHVIVFTFRNTMTKW